MSKQIRNIEHALDIIRYFLEQEKAGNTDCLEAENGIIQNELYNAALVFLFEQDDPITQMAHRYAFKCATGEVSGENPEEDITDAMKIIVSSDPAAN